LCWSPDKKILLCPYEAQMEEQKKTFHEIAVLVAIGIFFIAVFVKIVFF
jgi:hypothetical protein